MTLGPKSWDLVTLDTVISRRHMGAARINCSHAKDQSDYGFLHDVSHLVRRIACNHGQHIPVFYDTPGWKLRLVNGFVKRPFPKGSSFTIDEKLFPFPDYLRFGEVGSKVYLGDGKPRLTVVERKGSTLGYRSVYGCF